jgi:hypothetical protein
MQQPLLKSLALRVLERNRRGNNAATVVSKKVQQPPLFQVEKVASAEGVFHPAFLLVLKERAGPEWEEIKDSPKKLYGFVEAVRINLLIEAGVIPSTFIYHATCQKCGEIQLDYQIEELLVACPWCFNT